MPKFLSYVNDKAVQIVNNRRYTVQQGHTEYDQKGYTMQHKVVT